MPRIGQEVVVQFVEGDPDRPLVLGSVYNAEQIPPYLPPDHATVSIFRSRSSEQGGAADFNELAFEGVLVWKWATTSTAWWPGTSPRKSVRDLSRTVAEIRNGRGADERNAKP